MFPHLQCITKLLHTSSISRPKKTTNRIRHIPQYASIKPMDHDDPTDSQDEPLLTIINHSFKPHASFQELALDHEQIADPRHLRHVTWAWEPEGLLDPARVKKWGVHP